MKLAQHTTLRLGGAAREFWTAESEEEVLAAVRRAKALGLPLHVLGGGSNLVVSDDGVDAVVLRLAERGVRESEEADRTVALVGAGMPWDDWVRLSVERGCAGLECLSGIPGEVGATPIQNVGAYGQEVAETISRLRVLDREAETIDWMPGSACGFGYRTSRFKGPDSGRLLVLAVEFSLPKGERTRARYPELERALAERADGAPSLAQVRETVLDLRRQKSMLLDPSDENGRSCGSFFTNPVLTKADVERVQNRAGEQPPSFPQPDGRIKVPAAWLIERAGLSRGTRHGSVGLSTRHTLALVAHDGATTAEIVRFAWHVRERVEAAFGVRLWPEPVFWGFSRLDDGLPALE